MVTEPFINGFNYCNYNKKCIGGIYMTEKNEISNKWVLLGVAVVIGVIFIGVKPMFSDASTSPGATGLSGIVVPIENNAMPSAPCHFMAGQYMGKCTVREIELVAEQWEWSEPTITVNEGDIVRLKVTSKDVSHGFAVPQFDVNFRIEPGKTITEEFMASKKGEFEFGCSVMCGPGHHEHKGRFIVK